jgi:hypothetical protein
VRLVPRAPDIFKGEFIDEARISSTELSFLASGNAGFLRRCPWRLHLQGGKPRRDRMRWDFAGSTSSAMPYLTPTNTDGRTCVGCRALSPNGDKLIASAGGQNDGRLLLWSVAANSAIQPFPLAQKS